MTPSGEQSPAVQTPLRVDPASSPRLVDVLGSFLPRVIQQRFAADPRPLQSTEMHSRRGALLFLDLSGFTAMTEDLAREGREGIEELSRVLNGYFDRLITTVLDYGGDVVKLAGDGVVATWDARDAAGVAAVTVCAAECGLAARRALTSENPPGDYHVDVKAAVGAGEIGIMLLGGVLDRWELLLVGDTVEQIGIGSRLAGKGQLVASPEAWPHLDGRFEARTLSDGFIEIVSALRPSPACEAAAPALPNAAQEALLTCVPGAIRSRLLAGQSGWLAELRRVAVLFVNLPAWDRLAVSDVNRTQAVMRSLQGLIYQFEGSINKLSVDDKGVSLVAAMGLPPFAHEDDPIRAVRCGLLMQARLRELQVQSAIGIATGRVFCGSLGTARRREYTVIGDVVNLAARLMQAAPGDILCDEHTRRASEARVGFEALPVIQVKGKAAPVAVYRPYSQAVAGRSHRPIVGRTSERLALALRLERVAGGGRAAVLIEGEAGIGKSRLAAEVLRICKARRIRHFTAVGSAVDQASAYHAWRPVFAELLHVDDSAPLEKRRAAVLEAIGDDPAIRRMAPLLNGVLPLDFGETDFTRQLSGQLRADNTNELLLRLLDREARRGPLVVLVEDAQWMDSASLGFAVFVSRQLTPSLVVVVSRPLPEPLTAEHAELLTVVDERFQLGPLSVDETTALVSQRLGVREIPPALVTLVARQAHGNPFFSEELASSLRDAGVLRVEGETCTIAPGVELEAVAVPDSIEAVITGRMDRLPPEQQLTLKVASVIGRVFGCRILHDIHPIESERARLGEHLASFERFDLTQPDPSGTSYAFEHAVTHEVAYNLLLFTQRRQLHKAVAEWHEQVHAADLSDHYALLAYHYTRADDPERARIYLDLAGEQSLRRGAYREAIAFYEEAVRLHGEAGTTSTGPGTYLARRAIALGEAHMGLGNLDACRAHILQALALLGEPAPAGGAALGAGLVRQALVQLGHAIRPFGVAGGPAAERERLRQAAVAYERLGHVGYFQTTLPLVGYSALRCVNLAERAGSAPELARTYADMAVVAMIGGLKSLARRYCRRAEALVDTIDDQVARAWILELTGIYRSSMGDWEKADQDLGRAIQVSTGIGDVRRLEESTVQLGIMCYQRGDFAASLEQGRRVRELADRHGHPQARVWGTQLMAVSLTRLGRLDEAAVMSDDVQPDRTATLGLTEQVWQFGSQALCRWRAGRVEEARRAAESGAALIRVATPFANYDLEGYNGVLEALVEMAAAESRSVVRDHLLALAGSATSDVARFARIFPLARPRLLVWRGVVARMQGYQATAARAWRKAIEIAEGMQLPYDAALARLYAGATLPPDSPKRSRLLAGARDTFVRLGATHDLARVERLIG
jgi:class 3 adenylate cyclase/tetratricopeptide (TPR) repeat protein